MRARPRASFTWSIAVMTRWNHEEFHRVKRKLSIGQREPKKVEGLPAYHALAGESGGIAQLLLYPDELVIFRQTVGAGQRTGLDLTAVGRDCQIGDGGILGLARAVRHDGGV